MNKDPDDSIEYNGIRFLPEAVARYDGSKAVDAVYRKDIRGIALRYTWSSQSAVWMMMIAILFMFESLYRFGDWLLSGQRETREIVVFLVLALFSVVLLFQLRKRGPVLVLKLRMDQRNMPFTTPIDIGQVRKLLEGAKAMGYPVDMTSVDAFRQPKR